MPAEQSFYEGRKGQKRLKAIEKQIKRISQEFDHNYSDTPEMRYLDEEIRWDPMARLIFILARRNVYFKWTGLRDYGFIRLCRKWVTENRITYLDPEAASNMIGDILPAKQCTELKDDLAALEIF